MIYPPFYTTGIHHTDEIVEWTVLRKSRSHIEKFKEGTIPIPENFFDQENPVPFPSDVLPHIRNNFRGPVTVSLSTSKLLMWMLELPSTDLEEIRGMVALHIDQNSPFPIEQLTLSHEILLQTDDHSRVLAVAAPRKIVDALGDLFKTQNVYIRRLDSEALTWWSLLRAHEQIPLEGRVVLILKEHTEFFLIVVENGVPICFRSLELFRQLTDETNIAEIAEEINYTLLSLETDYGSRKTEAVLFWSNSDIPKQLCELLQQQCNADVTLHNFDALPPLSEGLALRMAEQQSHHVELVPREWVDLQHRRKLIKISSIVTIVVLSIWLMVVAAIGVVFSVRQATLKRISQEAEKYAGPARAAQIARKEMLALEQYADRSHSALKCLREVTLSMPDDLEITSYTYKKGGAVSLRGSSPRSDVVYNFFQKLGASDQFEGVKDQPVSTRLVKNQRISTFAITAELPKPEKEESP